MFYQFNTLRLTLTGSKIVQNTETVLNYTQPVKNKQKKSMLFLVKVLRYNDAGISLVGRIQLGKMNSGQYGKTHRAKTSRTV